MYLLDTNVVSELRKVQAGRADPAVAAWANGIAMPDLFISVVTLEELEIGVLLAERRDAAPGWLLRAWLEHCVLPGFTGRILSIDAATVRHSARLQVPDPRLLRDAYIAATGLQHGLTVVTRNVRDFAATGVRLLNPWDWPPKPCLSFDPGS